MAQIGCFVPCKAATIPIRDRLLSRMGSSDDMEVRRCIPQIV